MPRIGNVHQGFGVEWKVVLRGAHEGVALVRLPLTSVSARGHDSPYIPRDSVVVCDGPEPFGGDSVTEENETSSVPHPNGSGEIDVFECAPAPIEEIGK